MTATIAYRRTGPRQPAGGAALVDDAWTVLAQHTDDEFGMCAGCRGMWNRLVPYPCTQAVWAQAVTGRSPTAETMAALGLRSA